MMILLRLDKFVKWFKSVSNHLKADKKSKLNNFNSSTTSSQLKLSREQDATQNNLFNLAKGQYFGEDRTYRDFQRSGVITLDKGIRHNL